MQAALLPLVVAALLAGCKKPAPDTESGPPAIAAPAARPADAAPPPPPPEGQTLAGLATPWGESVPAGHVHPEGVAITVFDIGGQIYDLSVRGLPAVNPAGDIAYASSVSVGDLDYSNLALVIAAPSGAVKETVVIFDAVRDAGDREEPIPIAEVRARAARANARLAGKSWRAMIALESTGPLAGGAEQKLVSRDRAVAATFIEPALTIRTRDRTVVVDAAAWSRPGCAPGVLLSGIWFDPPTGAVVARVGYDGTGACAADPIFAVAKG